MTEFQCSLFFPPFFLSTTKQKDGAKSKSKCGVSYKNRFRSILSVSVGLRFIFDVMAEKNSFSSFHLFNDNGLCFVFRVFAWDVVCMSEFFFSLGIFFLSNIFFPFFISFVFFVHFFLNLCIFGLCLLIVELVFLSLTNVQMPCLPFAHCEIGNSMTSICWFGRLARDLYDNQISWFLWIGRAMPLSVWFGAKIFGFCFDRFFMINFDDWFDVTRRTTLTMNLCAMLIEHCSTWNRSWPPKLKDAVFVLNDQTTVRPPLLIQIQQFWKWTKPHNLLICSCFFDQMLIITGQTPECSAFFHRCRCSPSISKCNVLILWHSDEKTFNIQLLLFDILHTYKKKRAKRTNCDGKKMRLCSGHWFEMYWMQITSRFTKFIELNLSSFFSTFFSLFCPSSFFFFLVGYTVFSYFFFLLLLLLNLHE